MYVLTLICDQGDCYAMGFGACTDVANADTFNGVVDAVKWLFHNRAYLEAIGCKYFSLDPVMRLSTAASGVSA